MSTVKFLNPMLWACPEHYINLYIKFTGGHYDKRGIIDDVTCLSFGCRVLKKSCVDLQDDGYYHITDSFIKAIESHRIVNYEYELVYNPKLLVLYQGSSVDDLVNSYNEWVCSKNLDDMIANDYNDLICRIDEWGEDWSTWSVCMSLKIIYVMKNGNVRTRYLGTF